MSPSDLSPEIRAKRMRFGLRALDDLIIFAVLNTPQPAHPFDPSFSRFEWRAHHYLVAERLQDLAAGRIKRLEIELPPRHGKTELGVRNFVPWLAGKFPRKSGIVVTHTDTLAKEHGRDCRDYWRGPGFALVFGQNSQGALREDSQASDRLQTKAGGTVTFSGRGGLGAGVGADWMVFDDFFKNSQEAQSETVRNEAWRTFVADCQTRLNNEDAPVLMIGSRRHEDDVQGRLFDPANPHYDAAEAAKWTRIRIPALSEGQDLDALKRLKDESLWPDKFSAGFYLAKKHHKSDIVRIDFETQDQCNPSPLEGTWFKKKWLKTYTRDELPKRLRYYASSDHAYRTKEQNDSNCILVAGMDPTGAIYILPETFWQKCETDVLAEQFIKIMSGPRRPEHWWAARDAISGSMLPFLRRRQMETKVFFWVDDSISEGRDLIARSVSIRGMMAMGLVYWPSDWPQWPECEKQLLCFPGKKDDVVAALAMMGMGIDRMNKPAGEKPDNTPPKGTFAWHSMGQEQEKKSWF